MDKNVKFSTFGLKNPDKTKTIKVCGQDVQIRQYLPAAEKNSLLEIIIQQADSATILNPFAVDVFFDLYTIFSYSDIDFSMEEDLDLFELYDILEQNGIIDQILEAIPAEEYTLLRNYLIDMISHYDMYRNSARAILDRLSSFAPNPQNAEEFKKLLDSVDVDKAKEVLGLAEETGIHLVKD